MTREDYKNKKAREYRDYSYACGVRDPYMLDEIQNSYRQGMSDADENPDPKKLAEYLHRLGYPITLNGDILEYKEVMESYRLYNKYMKQRLIDEACSYLRNMFETVDANYYETYVRSVQFNDVDNFIGEFEKKMENCI